VTGNAAWTPHVLGDLLERIEAGRSFGAASRPAQPEEWGIVKVSAMTYGEFREEENKALPAGVPIDARSEIRQGDLLLSRANTREHVGAAVLVGHCRPRLLLSDKSLRLHPLAAVDRGWLLFALRTPSARAYLSAESGGVKAGMHNISQAALRAMPLLVPPLLEQRRIVGSLEAAFSRLASTDASLLAAQRKSKALRRSLLAAAIPGAGQAGPT